MVAARIALGFALSFLAGLVFFPFLRLPRRSRSPLLALFSVAIFTVPLLIPGEYRLTRAVAAIQSLLVAAKLFDIHQQREPPPSFTEFAAFLFHPFTLVLRRLHAERDPPPRENMTRIGIGLAMAAMGTIIGGFVFPFDFSTSPLLLEHAVKVSDLYLTASGAILAMTSTLRALGLKARDAFDRPFLAHSPADFWRRYNRLVGQSFHENIFKRIGGFRAPVRATFVVFAVSALMHEYIFSIALMKVEGYQTAFFLLQGLGAIATLRMKPSRSAIIPCIAGTLLFNLTSSLLFFASVHQCVEFWSSSPFGAGPP